MRKENDDDFVAEEEDEEDEEDEELGSVDEAARNDTATLTTIGAAASMTLAGKEIFAGGFLPDRTASERVIKNYVKSYLFKYVS